MNHALVRFRSNPCALSILLLLGFLFIWSTDPLAAQNDTGRVQQVNGRLPVGETTSSNALWMRRGPYRSRRMPMGIWAVANVRK